MTQNRKGFTLIEALIAITVLVILAGVTVFSTLDLVTVADAKKIINDMIHLKTAMLMWYKENSSRIVYDAGAKQYKINTKGTIQPFKEFIGKHKDEILRYVSSNDIKLRNKESSANDTGDYTFIDTDEGTRWFICCNLGSLNLLTKGEEAPDIKVREKIAGQANKLNLFGLDNITNTPTKKYTANNKFVCMLVIEWKK